MLWEKFYSLNPLPKCTCDALKEYQKRDESKRAHQFLMRFNEDFSSLRGQMLLTIPLPNVAYIHSLCVQDETQKKMRASSTTIDVNTIALPVTKGNSKGKGKATPMSTPKQEPPTMVKHDEKFKHPKEKHPLHFLKELPTIALL